MNIWIVYDSKYGNNKVIAEALADHFKDGNTLHIHYAKEISQQKVIDGGVDMLIMGGPIHLGMISFTMKNWAIKMVTLLNQKKIKLKKAAMWGTHIEDPPNAPPKTTWEVVKQQWKAILDSVPAEKKVPESEGLIVGPVAGRDTLNPEWPEIVLRFANKVKNL